MSQCGETCLTFFSLVQLGETCVSPFSIPGSNTAAEEDSSKKKGRRMRKTFDRRILYGQMDDAGQSCQNMSEADGQRCKL